MSHFLTRAGNHNAYAMACGYVQEFGPLVTLKMEHGLYWATRSPWARAGYAASSARTLAEGRRLARLLAKNAGN